MVKYIRYTLASNFGNCYALAMASLFISFLPLLPVQILLLNLLSDFPLISVAVDNVDKEEVISPLSFNLKETAALIILLGVISSFFDFCFLLFLKIRVKAYFRLSGLWKVFFRRWFLFFR